MSNFNPGWLGLTDANSDFNALHFTIEQALAGVRTVAPVKVIAIHTGGASDQFTVDVQPLVNQVDGRGNPSPHGTIYGVPVANLSGSNGSVSIAPAAGDIGLILVCDRDISSAYAAKGIANPGSRRMHDLSDSIYIGGFGAMNTSAHQVLIASAGITINSTKTVTINAPNGLTIAASGGITITGDVAVTGKITASGDVAGNNVHLSTHIHAGVAVGGASTAAPTAGT